MKLPSFQFYPGDWLKDANLRRCSHAARGVWMDMLCLMFECEDRGVLQTDGRAWSDDEIAQAVGGLQDVTVACIRELVEKGVARRRSDGAVYSARLVRDEEQRRRVVKRQQKKRNAGVTPMSRLAEVEDEDDSVLFESLIPEKLRTDRFLSAWKVWVKHRSETRKPLTEQAARSQLADCAEWGEAEAVESIKASVGSGWQGLFKPKPASGPTAKPQAVQHDFLAIVKAASANDPRRLPRC